MRASSLAAVLALALTGITGAQAQQFPSKPITIVVGFPPGGPTDAVARILGERMKTTLGEPVVVENQAGAAGTIAGNRVAHAEPDGHTLSLGQWTSNVGSPAIPFPFNTMS